MGIETVVGTNTLLELVSQSHGAVRVPLAQNFDYTPAFDERRIFEFDSAEAVAIVTNFDGVEISFNYFDTDSKLVDTSINDLDPSAVATVDDPANYKEITIMLNIRRPSDSVIFQSVLCKFTRIRGSATGEPVREEGAITRDGTSTNVLRLKGVALEYSRLLRSGSSAFAQGNSNSQADKVAALVSGNFEADTDNTPQAVEAADADLNGKALILVLKNGDKFDNATLVGSTITIPEADFSTDDVFEAFTTYIDS
ncbi:MAG: hypothetical protein E2O29_01960 [Deltaproteobacteria bacterium]|nr:MAG: hypothetical protein E2O29_01960 [Deltaproteobacteria bacterium]